MKTPLIHRGLFVESMRRLRVAGILLTVIPLMLAIPGLILDIFNALRFNPYYTSYFRDIYPHIYALPFIAPPVLTAILFSAQTKRCDSDFYHSLPLTKRNLNTSWVAAVMCWLTVIIVGSGLVIWAISIPIYFIDPLNALLTIGGALLASFMVTAVLFLAYSLSGNTVTALFFAVITLFAPIAVVYMLSLPLSNYHPVMSLNAANIAQYQLLYGNQNKPMAWVVTALITVVCLLLGYAAAGKRRSELAGQAATTRVLQTVLRLTAAYVCCLPAIYTIFSNDEALLAVICYAVALIVYFLFELFTTKKAKNMLKAIPWLGVLVVLNVLSLIGMNVSSELVYLYSPSANEVNSVSITELHEYYTENDKYYNPEAWGLPSADVDDDSADTYYSSEDFWFFESIYDEYHIADVKLTDMELRTIACDALKRNLEYSRTTDSYDIVDLMQKDGRGEVFFRVTLAFHGDLHTRYRTVWLYSGEFVALFDAIDVEAHLPENRTFDPDILDAYI